MINGKYQIREVMMSEKAMTTEPPNFSTCSVCDAKTAKVFCETCYRVRYCGPVCRYKDLDYHRRICHPVDKTLVRDKSNIAFHEALKLNLLSEFQILHRLHDSLSLFNRGRYLIYKAVIAMILFDPVNADMKYDMTPKEKEMWNQLETDIRKGGELIHQQSPDLMRDSLLWSFIPQTVHRFIDHTWSGIGSWQS